MKRSLDLDGLHEALPPTCRAVSLGGIYSERQLAKRTRLGEANGSMASWIDSPSPSSWSSRQVHTLETDMVAESIVNSLQSKEGERIMSTCTPHTDRHLAAACTSTEHGTDPFRAARDVNPFPVRGPPLMEELDEIVSGLSPLRKKMFSEGFQGSEGEENREQPQTPIHSSAGEKLYTHDELRAVVNKALSIQGASLRSEYNGILQSKLAEQFQSFTKFNQDYISRQIKGNPFSYVS